MAYNVRPHDDHYHVVDERITHLDDRPYAPYLFNFPQLACDVALLLTHGVINEYATRVLDPSEIHDVAEFVRRWSSAPVWLTDKEGSSP